MPNCINLDDLIASLNAGFAGLTGAIENIALPTNGESEEMSISITNTNCCGCGCNGANSNTPPVDYTIPLPEEPPVNAPPVNTPPVSPDNAQKCSMANYLVYSLRLTLLKVMENGGDFVTFTAWWSGLFESVSGFTYALAYQTWQWAKQALTGESLDVNDIFDEFYNLYVCNLFSSTSTVTAHEAMQATLFTTLKGYPNLSYVARIIANELPYDLLFKDSGAIEIPAGFANRECCGSVQDSGVPLPFDLPLNQTYRVIPVKTAQLNLTVKSAHVTMAVDETVLSGASTIKVTKPTLHYGDGTPSWLFSGVATANNLTAGWVKMGMIVEYVFSTHYGYPVGTFGNTIKNQDAPSTTGFYSVAILQPEIEAIDGGAFISQFDVLKYPSETLLDSQSAKVDFLNHANVAYNGYATLRLYALFKVV